MKIETHAIDLDPDDYKELFSIFCSPTDYEISQIYDPDSDHYFKKVKLDEEYSLTQERREFSIDAWRSVIMFLKNKGFSLSKNKEEINLSFIERNLY